MLDVASSTPSRWKYSVPVMVRPNLMTEIASPIISPASSRPNPLRDTIAIRSAGARIISSSLCESTIRLLDADRGRVLWRCRLSHKEVFVKPSL